MLGKCPEAVMTHLSLSPLPDMIAKGFVLLRVDGWIHLDLLNEDFVFPFRQDDFRSSLTGK